MEALAGADLLESSDTDALAPPAHSRHHAPHSPLAVAHSASVNFRPADALLPPESLDGTAVKARSLSMDMQRPREPDTSPKKSLYNRPAPPPPRRPSDATNVAAPAVSARTSDHIPPPVAPKPRPAVSPRPDKHEPPAIVGSASASPATDRASRSAAASPTPPVALRPLGRATTLAPHQPGAPATSATVPQPTVNVSELRERLLASPTPASNRGIVRSATSPNPVREGAASPLPRPLPELHGPRFTRPPPPLPLVDTGPNDGNYKDLKVRTLKRETNRSNRRSGATDVRNIFAADSTKQAPTAATPAPPDRASFSRGGSQAAFAAGMTSELQAKQSAVLKALVLKPKRGWLWKRGGKDGNKGWNRRLFVLENGALMYFKRESESKAISKLDVRDMLSIEPSHDQSRPGLAFDLKTVGRTYIIAAESTAELTDWFIALGAVIANKADFDTKNVEEKVGYLFIKPSDSRDWDWYFVAVRSGNIAIYKVRRAAAVSPPSAFSQSDRDFAESRPWREIPAALVNVKIGTSGKKASQFQFLLTTNLLSYEIRVGACELAVPRSHRAGHGRGQPRRLDRRD